MQFLDRVATLLLLILLSLPSLIILSIFNPRSARFLAAISAAFTRAEGPPAAILAKVSWERSRNRSAPVSQISIAASSRRVLHVNNPKPSYHKSLSMTFQSSSPRLNNLNIVTSFSSILHNICKQFKFSGRQHQCTKHIHHDIFGVR